MPQNSNPLELVDHPDVQVIPPTAIEAIERAEIDIAIATAKRYPRDISVVTRDMREMATKDPDIAADCTYVLPRAGKLIKGPSVRLAEIVFSCYGNLNAGARIVSANDEEVTCQAVCHDLQKNIRLAIEIPRTIYASKKTEDREAAIRDARHTTSLAALKIGFREAVFAVVPRSVFTKIWYEAQEVAAGKGKSFDESRAAALERFKALGVSPKEVCDYLEIGGVEALTTGHLQILYGLLTAIKDSDTTVENEFGPRKKARATELPPGPPPAAPVKAQVPVTGVTDYVLKEPEKLASQPPPAAPPRKTKVEEDFLPDLGVKATRKPPPPAKDAKPKKEAATPSSLAADPIYERVAKKIEESKITLADFLRVLRDWGLAGAEVQTLEQVKVAPLRAAYNEWQAVIDDIALRPENEDTSRE